jgi:hypothetical protein
VIQTKNCLFSDISPAGVIMGRTKPARAIYRKEVGIKAHENGFYRMF